MGRPPESWGLGVGIGAAFDLSSEKPNARGDPVNESPKPFVRKSLSNPGESVALSLSFEMGSGGAECLTFQAPEVTRPDLCPLTNALSLRGNFHAWSLLVDKTPPGTFPRTLLFVGSLSGLVDRERDVDEASGRPRRIGAIASRIFSRTWVPAFFTGVEAGDCDLYVTKSSSVAFLPTFIERGESGACSGIVYANRDFVPRKR